MLTTRLGTGNSLTAYGWLAGFVAFVLANALLRLGLDWWPDTVRHHHSVWFGMITLGISATIFMLHAVLEYRWSGFVYMCAAAAASLMAYAAYVTRW